MKKAFYLLPLIAMAACQPSPKVVGDAPIDITWPLANGRSFYPFSAQADPQFKLESLDKVPLPTGDREIRIYGGFGLVGMDVIVLRQKSGTWNGHHIGQVGEQYKTAPILTRLRAPAEGWDKFINRLEAIGLFSLPEAEWLENRSSGFDGHSYVVAIQQNGAFRHVTYSQPDGKHGWLPAYALLTCVELLRLLFVTSYHTNQEYGPGVNLRKSAKLAPDDPGFSSWMWIDHLAWRAKDLSEMWEKLPEPNFWMLSDIDGNGIADEKDLAIVKANLGKKTAPNKALLPADANGDGVVDQTDIAIVTPAAKLKFKMPWTDGSYP